ncbi:Arc-like DNA binding domain [Serratia quinivorans]|nr:Arc-like DNA binding domain [Serratia quinivorans]
MTKQYSPYPFRMPAEMRADIESKAKAAGRSLQQEMLKRIELSMELENLFRTVGVDSLYSIIATNWRVSHTAEIKCIELEAEIEKLKENNRLLAKSSNVSDDVKFMNIRRNLETALSALEKISHELPPKPEPIKRPT